MKEKGNKLIILSKNPPTPDHIGGVVKGPLRAGWYDSISKNFEKTEQSTTFSALLKSLLLPTDKFLHPQISF